ASSLGRAARATAPPASEAAERLNALFDVFMEERFEKNPDMLTILGLDKGKYAWAKSKLTEASLQWVRESKQDNASRLKRLRAFDRGTLSGADLANYDTVEYQLETTARTGPFEYGDAVRPYVVSQLTGSYQSVPTFLDRQHRIDNKEDAEAYLARLRAFATVLDEETERVRHDAGLKVVPPDFLIDRTRDQMRDLRGTAPADSILATSIGKRAQKLGLTTDYGAEASRIVGAEVYPALDRQMRSLAELRPAAAHDAGVGRLPQGEALYQVALRFGTTTDMTADQVHTLGLDQVKELDARMDTLLRAQGKKSGTVSERMQALARDPQYLYPDTDPGRQQILDYCNGLITSLQPRLEKYFHVRPNAAVEIRRVPVYTEAGAACCVVDTGLTAEGWSRERAIDSMVATTGENATAMTTEVERYCTWPGQACSYKVGHTRWLALRAEARRRLGAKFDIRDFHDVGLTAAPMPLAVLERVVGEWLASRQA